jgi:hypothetical protein
MDKSKIVSHSVFLEREFHCDFISIGNNPLFTAIFIGGSGIDKSEYQSRNETIVDVFDGPLSELEKEGYSFNFVYYTAPYDIPYAKVEKFYKYVDCWNEHFSNEVLCELGNKIVGLRQIPIYLMAYSGGAVLSLSGLQLSDHCFGAGLLGADGLHFEMTSGDNWKEPITIYYNIQDPVFHVNKNTIEDLVAYDEMIFYRTLNGSHSIKDYIKNDSFSGLIRRANRILKS